VAYSLADFARFCSFLTLDNGKPFKLLPFEQDILRPYFKGATETVIILSKKNGKTTMLGALALYHLKNVPDAECVIGASSRDQATILFNQAAALVRRSGKRVAKTHWEIDGTVFDVRSGYRLIRLVDNPGARIRVLAADAGTADGVIPTLAIVDELHRHPSAELYGVFRDGLTPRNGQMLTISTAGAKLESPLGHLRQQAHALPSFKREGVRNSAISEDGAFAFLEWCLEDTDDVHDMKVVKRVNPAPWHTLKSLAQRHDSPGTTPAQWLRFACGIWTTGETPAIQPAEWDALRVDIGQVSEGEEVFGYISGTKEQAAIVLAAKRPENKLAVWADVLDVSDASLFDQCIDRLVEIGSRYSLAVMGYDSAWFSYPAEILTNRGLPMEDDRSVPLRLGIASGTLLRFIQSGDLMHDGNLKLREHVLKGAIKDNERGWRFLPTASNRALIALAMAVHSASFSESDVLMEVM